MVNGIGAPGMRHTQQDFYKKADNDGSGGISRTELQTMAEKLKEKSGTTLDASDEAFSDYDSDGDNTLSPDELNTVMQNSGFGPALGMQGGAPPVPPQQGMEAYSSSGSSTSSQDDLTTVIDSLMALLEKLSASSTTDADTAGTTNQAGKQHGHGGIFKDTDTDGSGGVSQDELKVLAQNMRKTTGQTLDATDEAFAGYDSDGDGALSADELKGAMDANGFAPPQGAPPPAMQASSGASLEDQVSELQKLIESLSKYVESGAQSGQALSVTT